MYMSGIVWWGKFFVWLVSKSVGKNQHFFIILRIYYINNTA